MKNTLFSEMANLLVGMGPALTWREDVTRNKTALETTQMSSTASEYVASPKHDEYVCLVLVEHIFESCDR